MADASLLMTPMHWTNPLWGVVATGASVAQYVCVSFTTSGTLRVAENDDTATMPAIGISISAGTKAGGEYVQVLTEGIVTNSAWAWTVGGAVYLGADGTLTQTAPTANGSGVQMLGQARTATSVWFSPGINFLAYPATGYPVDVAATEADGSAATLARSDHRHKMGILTTQGDLLYGGAAGAGTRLGVGAAGTVLRSDGTNPLYSTFTIPDTMAINTLLYASAANILAALATANNGVLVTGGTGIPSVATDLPTAVTIGGQYVYRVGGTDVSVADGGTGLSTIAINQILYASALDTLAGLATANNGLLVTSGTGVPSISTDLPTAVTIGGGYIYRVSGTDVSLADGGTGASLSDPNADRILFWDDSAGAVAWLAPDATLGITLTNVGLALGNANTWTATQTFSPTATRGAINIVPTAGNPSALADGDLWYNDTTGKFRGREEGVSKDIITAGTSSFSTKFRAYRSGNQSIPSATWTKVQLNAEHFDTDGDFDAVTNYRFTTPATGYYALACSIYVTDAYAANLLICNAYKNGAGGYPYNYGSKPTTSDQCVNAADIVYLVANDYVELFGYQSAGSAQTIYGTASGTFLSMHRIS